MGRGYVFVQTKTREDALRVPMGARGDRLLSPGLVRRKALRHLIVGFA
jgi:hypothetical protein